MKQSKLGILGFALVSILGFSSSANAVTISFNQDDFTETNVFSNILEYNFSIELENTIRPGGVYENPALVGVEYLVRGRLADGTPSGFPGFRLERTISGTDFYAQGSSLSFSISNSADLTDGLQLSELVGDNPVFVFNGREVGTGRYHPSLVQLNANGTGLLRNSNNFGGINPASNEEVDVKIGDEYITELRFDPNNLTLTEPIETVPEKPVHWLSLGLNLGLLKLSSKRKKSNL